MQAFPFEVILGLEADSAMASFWSELWHQDLRAWFKHFLSDLIKTLSVLAGLYLFWEAIAWFRFRGYPDELCQRLEKTHFAFTWMTLCVISGNFILKQTVALWKKKR